MGNRPEGRLIVGSFGEYGKSLAGLKAELRKADKREQRRGERRRAFRRFLDKGGRKLPLALAAVCLLVLLFVGLSALNEARETDMAARIATDLLYGALAVLALAGAFLPGLRQWKSSGGFSLRNALNLVAALLMLLMAVLALFDFLNLLGLVHGPLFP